MNIQYISSTSSKDNNFVGVKINKDKIEIFHPEFLNFNHANVQKKLQDVRDLLNIIYNTNLIEEHEFGGKNLSDVRLNRNLFNSYKWIIEFYLSGGNIKDWLSVKRTDYKGKINWRMTMSSYPKVIDDYFFYDKIVSKRLELADISLVEIFNFCVNKALENLGWLYNFQPNSQNLRSENLDNYISFVKKQLHYTNNERRKELLLNMLSILIEVVSEKENYVTVFGTNNFNLVFEYMINLVFNNVENISDYYPNSWWELEGKIFGNSKLRPDAVLTYGSDVFLIDAKYYRYETTHRSSDLPGTDSIQKQLTYQDHIKNVLGLNVVNNLFIVPNHSKEKVKYLGKAKACWRQVDNTINLFSIGLETLMELVNSSQKEKETTRKSIVQWFV